MQDLDDIATGDYVVPIYVDTGALIDVLASIEGGFTSIEKFASKEEDKSESAAGRDFAVGGVLSFLKLDLKAAASKKGSSASAEERTGERYHSPGSLLNRLRRYLREAELLRRPHWRDVKPSEFIEFRGVFRPNPLAEALGSMKQILEVLKAWPQYKQQKKSDPVTFTDIEKMLGALLKDMGGGGRKLFVIEPTGEPSLRVVAPVIVEHLRDRTQAELAHGDFRVTAKVVRRLDEPDGEGIHLLPGSGIGAAGGMLESLVAAVQTLRAMGMKVPEKVDVEVKAPAVVVLPIGISI